MDHWRVNLSRTMVPETLSETSDKFVQELQHHMPRIVENKQRLCLIVGQLACDHYGLEPQMNEFF